MVNPVIKDGKLILVNGTLAGSLDCCCEEANPCTGFADCTGHAGSPGVAPSIALTMLDADYVGASKNWCGLTWTQADIQAGVTKCVCPTQYIIKTTPLLTNTIPVYGLSASNRETWDKAGGDGLHLARHLSHSNIFPSVPTHWYIYKYWFVFNFGAPAASDIIRRSYYQKRYAAANYNTYTNTENEFDIGLNPATDGNSAAVYNYKITDVMFGNYTDTNGINWKWAKGLNWT